MSEERRAARSLGVTYLGLATRRVRAVTLQPFVLSETANWKLHRSMTNRIVG